MGAGGVNHWIKLPSIGRMGGNVIDNKNIINK